MNNLKKILGAMVVGTFIFGFNLNANATTACSGEALIGDTCKDTIENAITEANSNGGTIELLKNAEVETFLNINTEKNVTLDLNEFNIEGKGNATILLTKGTLKITGSGKIINKNTASPNGTLCVYGSKTDVVKNSNLTIDSNVTIEGINPVNIILNADNQPVNFGTTIDIYGTILNNVKTNSTVSAALSTHGNIKNTTNAPIINIHDGATLSSTIEDGAGIYQAGYGQTTIDKATISGASGLIIKAGKANLNGATIKATGQKVSPLPSGNGFNGTGAAIQIESNDTYAGEIELIIDGGTYESDHNAAILEYVDTTDSNPNTKVKTIEIKDGDFIAASNESAINVSDKFKTNYANHNNFVKGGTFSSDVSDFIDKTTLGQSESGQVGKLHTITVEQPENGTINVNKNAVSGEEVTVIATPNAGYKLEKITVTKVSAAATIAMPIANVDNTVPVTDGKFTMPDENVNITATFVKNEAEKIKVTVLIKDEEKEYEVEKESTLQSLLDNLKKEGFNVIGFTNKDKKELDLTNKITENMYLIALLDDEKADKNPQTLDNIIPFLGLGLAGTIVCGIASKKYLH